MLQLITATPHTEINFTTLHLGSRSVLDQACKTFKTSCQQEFPWKISFQIFVEKLDPTPLLNAKLIRFGQLIHENPAFYKKKYFWPRNNLCLIRRISKGNYS